MLVYDNNSLLFSQWLSDDFLRYLREWENEIAAVPNLKQKEKRKLGLSLGTLEGLTITGR